MADAIDTIRAAAATATADGTRIDVAKALHRKAQIRLDWIASETSMGLHNPEEALSVLNEAITWAHQATPRFAGTGG